MWVSGDIDKDIMNSWKYKYLWKIRKQYIVLSLERIKVIVLEVLKKSIHYF